MLATCQRQEWRGMSTFAIVHAQKVVPLGVELKLATNNLGPGRVPRLPFGPRITSKARKKGLDCQQPQGRGGGEPELGAVSAGVCFPRPSSAHCPTQASHLIAVGQHLPHGVPILVGYSVCAPLMLQRPLPLPPLRPEPPSSLAICCSQGRDGARKGCAMGSAWTESLASELMVCGC